MRFISDSGSLEPTGKRRISGKAIDGDRVLWSIFDPLSIAEASGGVGWGCEMGFPRWLLLSLFLIGYGGGGFF